MRFSIAGEAQALLRACGIGHGRPIPPGPCTCVVPQDWEGPAETAFRSGLNKHPDMIGRLYRTTHGSKPVLAIGQASAERAWSPSDTWDACMSNTIMALTAPYQRPAPAASAAQERQEVITIASNATRVTRITWEGSDLAAARFIWRENLAVAVATWRYPLTAGLLESLSSRPVTL